MNIWNSAIFGKLFFNEKRPVPYGLCSNWNTLEHQQQMDAKGKRVSGKLIIIYSQAKIPGRAGSTPARTRLYQIGVSGIWDEIKDDFELYGLKNEEYREFRKNVNYEAFLVRRK